MIFSLCKVAKCLIQTAWKTWYLLTCLLLPVAHKCLAAELISTWSQCNRIENSTSFKLCVESAFSRAIETNIQQHLSPIIIPNTQQLSLQILICWLFIQCWTENTKHSWNSKWVPCCYHVDENFPVRKLYKFNLALVFRRKSEQNKTYYGQSSDNTEYTLYLFRHHHIATQQKMWISFMAITLSLRPTGKRKLSQFLTEFSLPSCCGLEPSFCLFLFDENISMGIFIYRLRNDEASRKCVL